MWFLQDFLGPIITLMIGILVTRELHKRDEEKEEADQKREERLTRMERTLNRHTRSLSALTRSSKITVDTLARHAEDLEELEDVTDQLQTAVQVNRDRLQKSEEYISLIRQQRQSRTIAGTDPRG